MFFFEMRVGSIRFQYYNTVVFLGQDRLSARMNDWAQYLLNTSDAFSEHLERSIAWDPAPYLTK